MSVLDTHTRVSAMHFIKLSTGNNFKLWGNQLMTNISIYHTHLIWQSPLPITMIFFVV